MGQKVNPIGLRIGVIRDWESRWYAGKDYAELLHEDLKVREYIAKRLADSSVSKVEIERAANRLNVTIHTAKPGMVIGKGGTEVEALRKALNSLTGKRVHINILEIKRADLDAKFNVRCALVRKVSKQWYLVVLVVLISPALNLIVKVQFLFILYVLISTMHMQKLIQLMVS